MGRKPLRLTADDYREMLDNSYDGMMIMDSRGFIVYANSAYLRLTASIGPDIIGKNMADLINDGYLKASSALMAMVQNKVVSFHHTFPDGTRVLTTSQPVLDAKGKVVKIITNVRDMTEIVKLKEALEEAERLMNSLPLHASPSDRFREGGIVAVSEEMKRVFSLADKVSGVDVTVLLIGESGVGKEVVADYIHRHSPRSDRKMVSINCGAIPAALLEAELFGYSGGSFTGALREGKPGIFETAAGSTLFLDEIGDTSPEFQLKLLRALETRTINRVGEHRDIAIDVRVLSATNRSLADMVKAGTFRKDLYYRLNVVEIEIPPLRSRPDDIIPLALLYLSQCNSRYKLERKFSAPVLRLLRSHEWPGNNRELKNFVERLVVLCSGEQIRLDDYYAICGGRGRPASPGEAEGDVVALAGIVPLQEAVASVEEKLLRLAFEEFGRAADMAAALHVNQSTISRKMRKYGLIPQDGQ